MISGLYFCESKILKLIETEIQRTKHHKDDREAETHEGFKPLSLPSVRESPLCIPERRDLLQVHADAKAGCW